MEAAADDDVAPADDGLDVTGVVAPGVATTADDAVSLELDEMTLAKLQKRKLGSAPSPRFRVVRTERSRRGGVSEDGLTG